MQIHWRMGRLWSIQDGEVKRTKTHIWECNLWWEKKSHKTLLKKWFSTRYFWMTISFIQGSISIHLLKYIIGNKFRGNEEKTILILKCFLKGTVWLLNEHKLCVQELQKLKTMIDDLHRFNCKLQIFKKSWFSY